MSWIQASIDKKATDIDAYRRGTRSRGGRHTWLLVTVGEGRQDSIMLDRNWAKRIHRAAFDRAFVLDLFENRVTELSAPPTPSPARAPDCTSSLIVDVMSIEDRMYL